MAYHIKEAFYEKTFYEKTACFYFRADALSLLLQQCRRCGFAAGCAVSVSFDFPAEQIIVHDPEESLGYDAADEYCLAHSSEVTIRFSLPAAADPARSFVQIAYDFYEPHYFTDMPTENGCYVFTSNIDTTDTTATPSAIFRFISIRITLPTNNGRITL